MLITVFFKKLIDCFLAVLGLSCCVRALSGCGEQGLPSSCMLAVIIVVASLVAELRLQTQGLQLYHMGLFAVARGPWST